MACQFVNQIASINLFFILIGQFLDDKKTVTYTTAIYINEIQVKCHSVSSFKLLCCHYVSQTLVDFESMQNLKI